MTIKPPDIVTQREALWGRDASYAPLELRQELADWAWEKWYNGQMAITLPRVLQEDMADIKQRKEALYPEPPSKIEEEMAEVIDARGWASHEASGRGIYREMRNPDFNRSNWERLQYMLNMPSEPIESYMQYEILKLQGRLAANEKNPKASSNEIKKALEGYEHQAAKHAFNAIA